MKRIVIISLAMLALTLLGSTPGQAFRGRHFSRVGVGVVVGPGWWGPGWWGPYYPYYPYYSAPPVVIQQQPETYIQQPSQVEQQSYWYFCREPEGYYPYVKKCPKGWLKVVPSPAPGGEEE